MCTLKKVLQRCRLVLSFKRKILRLLEFDCTNPHSPQQLHRLKKTRKVFKRNENYCKLINILCSCLNLHIRISAIATSNSQNVGRFIKLSQSIFADKRRHEVQLSRPKKLETELQMVRHCYKISVAAAVLYPDAMTWGRNPPTRYTQSHTIRSDLLRL